LYRVRLKSVLYQPMQAHRVLLERKSGLQGS
jgi:hypothetical protein